MPTETAEEMALEVFRTMVEAARSTRSMGRAAAKRAEYGLAVRCFDYAELYRDRASDIANIIRAIRRENRGDRMRASYEASVSEQVIHAETAWYDRGYEHGYAQGRQDALRGVQAAALYRHAELWLGRMRLTSADERRDIEACELAWAAAQAAEEIETQKGAGDDFDAMVRELRTLRARVTELERDARLGAVVREAVGCMNAYMVEGHTTAPGFTLRQERIISVHQLNVLRAIADALRAEESAMTPEDRRERGRR